MEQIYTIPVNEAFEASAADPSLGCPFCRLYNSLEQDELDLILGASMMEPDVRIRTNELGFCRDHFAMMLRRPKRLPLALILESHLAEQYKSLGRGAAFPGRAGENAAKKYAALEKSCYICSRIEYNFTRMQETAALLWENDEAFRQKTAAQPLFCLSHFAGFVAAAKERMARRDFADFYRVLSEQQGAYMEKLNADVSWFVKKFDYRYDAEPWGDAKDAPERAVAYLTGNLHDESEAKPAN
jgi:hypothetical protein